MDRVLLLPGNALLFRPCGPMLQRAPISFGLNEFSDLSLSTGSDPFQRYVPYPVPARKRLPRPIPPRLGGPDAVADCSRVARGEVELERAGTGPQRWTTRLQPPPSAAWTEYLELVRGGNDSAQYDVAACRRGDMMYGFMSWLASGSARPLLRRSPVAWSIHEGSWYPALLLRAALRSFEGTPLSAGNLSERCPFKGFCLLEESVLPTFAWQRFPHLVLRSRPPLVARTLEPVECAERAAGCAACHATPRSLSSLLAFASRDRDDRGDGWCGIKLVRGGAGPSGEEVTETLLREIQGRGQTAAGAGCWSRGFWSRVCDVGGTNERLALCEAAK